MKHINLLVLLLMISSIAFADGGGNNLTIVIPNVKNRSGNIEVGLFNKSTDFPKENKQFKKVVLKAAPNTKYTFKDLPDGEYAIAVMHDENADGRCNFNMLGIPKEGYGFSNNVRPKFAAPSFKSVKFSLTNNKTISVNLIY
ncbi:DUF2141 domain-containing protein [Haoranjiania flava]|uniref:DUF2141 domain-containing protein n=1 Tax=Haoranjiania flava TaxID=1856322 RepID=A0AAE3ILB1_9BACT|nr:DUF2141 domain-containing protein [Haoranjiania flava]MCU7693005.1 DUF2141 domain-containing protein [Haoranjiania flava]